MSRIALALDLRVGKLIGVMNALDTLVEELTDFGVQTAGAKLFNQ